MKEEEENPEPINLLAYAPDDLSNKNQPQVKNTGVKKAGRGK